MTTYTKDEARQIAETIFAQLGGTRRLSMMAGCKNFAFDSSATEPSASFRIGRNANGVNYCKITLTSDDLYRVEFKRIHGTKITDKGTTDGAYADMLVELFERTTGMYLSL